MLESIFNEVAGPPTQMFSCETYEIFKNSYFEEHLLTTTSVRSFFAVFPNYSR